MIASLINIKLKSKYKTLSRHTSSFKFEKSGKGQLPKEIDGTDLVELDIRLVLCVLALPERKGTTTSNVRFLYDYTSVQIAFFLY